MAELVRQPLTYEEIINKVDEFNNFAGDVCKILISNFDFKFRKIKVIVSPNNSHGDKYPYLTSVKKDDYFIFQSIALHNRFLDVILYGSKIDILKMVIDECIA